VANEEHLKILRQGVAAWNDWRDKNPLEKEADLSGADLSGADLSDANLSETNLSHANLSEAVLFRAYLRRANLSGAWLSEARLTEASLSFANLSLANLSEAYLNDASLFRVDLSEADLRGADLSQSNLSSARLSVADLSDADLTRADLRQANLSGARLSEANLSGANLRGADLSGANLSEADLSDAYLVEANLSGANLSDAYLVEAHLWGANLSETNLRGAQLIETDLRGATLTGSNVYGVSVWNIQVDASTKQQNLIITNYDEPVITVDNIKVAQFIYLMLNNQEIRDVIDTITSKVILILGRFTEERKAVLDAIRAELRNRNFTPVMFDFDKPASKDVTGTVETLARMARFIIADLTDPSSIPHELATVVPFLRTTPVLPIRLEGSGGYSMFDDLSSYAWVLEQHNYKDSESLISALPEVIAPADKMAEKFRKQRPP
jgi:uncharacterized protein YjbI with pentapeptide repeats